MHDAEKFSQLQTRENQRLEWGMWKYVLRQGGKFIPFIQPDGNAPDFLFFLFFFLVPFKSLLEKLFFQFDRNSVSHQGKKREQKVLQI